MSMANRITYYCGTVKLARVFPLRLDRFKAIGGVPSKHNRYDSFDRLAGATAGEDGRESAYMPVTRKIEYKRNPSKHKCDSRCRSATGHQCECSCGGQFHGAG